MSEERKKIEPKTIGEKKMREAFEQWYHSREFVPHGCMFTHLAYEGFKAGVEYAREILRRESTQPNTTDLIELEALVKAELEYPEKWDTLAYPTVWHVLWEAYWWRNGDRR